MLFVDKSTQSIEWALSAESERQRVTANNIANVNTPGFRSSRVDFESSLSQAMQSGDPTKAQVTESAANTPVNLNGNDVTLEDEMQNLTKSSIHYDALVQALNMKFNLVRTAIGR
jgi:flagellar basal-body rod protein FlgB